MPQFRVVKKRDEELSPDQLLIRQLDELQFLSQEYRREHFGIDWEKDVKEFYHITDGVGAVPSFRPKVKIPQLQLLMLNEATDLSDTTPIVYIAHKSQRDKDRERAFQQHWRQGYVNNRMLFAQLWSLLFGVGYLQVGFDAFARKGQGDVWVASRNPGSVYPDPYSLSEDDWQWVQWTDKTSVDKVASYWDKGQYVRPTGKMVKVGQGEPGGSFDLPPGPLSVTGGFPADKMISNGEVNVRYTFLYDNTRERLKDLSGSDHDTSQLVPAKWRLKYPDGRMIVDCEGIVLFDDNNPFPSRQFPLVRIPSLPALFGFYPPPPSRFTKSLQDLAERMYTQAFENMVRLNNGVWFIPEECGIDPDDFGGIPGEVRVIAANSKPPELKLPTPFPQQMTEYPDKLLALQKELQGFTSSRGGEPGAGNISSNLYDASIYQSQFLTRLRARLASESVQRFVELYFNTMVRYYANDRTFPSFGKGEDIEEVTWHGTSESRLEDFNIEIDPGSLRPVSTAALRAMVKDLRQQGMIDTKNALEMLDVPKADEIAEGIESEQKLAALAKVKQRR